MLKRFLTILLLTLTTNNTIACLSASQNRLFPLGLTSDRLLVVETHLNRTEYFDREKNLIKMEPAWFGKIYFKIYDQNYNEVYAELLDSISLFEEKYYDSILSRSFDKGLKLAKKYPDFIAASPLSIYFCDYQEICSKAKLKYDTTENKINIQLPGKNLYQINTLFNTTSIASNLISYLSVFYDDMLTIGNLKGLLFINSVRQFQIADQQLTIIHIGTGQKYNLAEDGTESSGNEYPADFEFTNIQNSIFQEPVLHHGHGFDFWVLE